MTEAQEQATLFKWAAQPSIRGRYPELMLLHHIKNETKEGAAQVAIDKRQGVKKGVPDLFLPVARSGWHGLFIEMKSPTGRLRPEQQWWLDKLREQGYLTECCYCWQDAASLLTAYMEGSMRRAWQAAYTEDHDARIPGKGRSNAQEQRYKSGHENTRLK